MKLKSWVATGVALLCMAAPLCADDGAVVGEAGLVCNQPVFDFGEARKDQTITNRFVLRNAGTNTISILNVRPSCGCTTATLATNRLAPGGASDLQFALSLAGRSGYQRKSIYVETDDPHKPRLKLEIAGQVISDLEVQPDGVHFGTLGRDGTAQRDVTITARSNVTFAIKSVSVGSTQFSAEAEPREAGKSYVLHIKSEGPRSPGTTAAIVLVVTDCPTTPSLTIPVTAFVAGDIVAVPTQLILVASGTNETRTANLTLYSPAGKAFTVKSADSPSPSVNTTVTNTAGNRVRIEVQSRGGLEDVEGKSIRIVTDMETAREILVPLRVLRPPVPAATAVR